MVNLNELIIFFIFFPLLIILIQVCGIYLFKFNLLKSFITSFIITDIVFLLILIFSIKLTFINSLFYLFYFLCLQYLYLGYFYTPNSSIRFKILDILIKNNFQIEKKKLLKNYNDNIIFKLRINRLLNSKTIIKKNNKIKIANKKVLIIYQFYNFFKKIIKNY
jgi:hypothetical protein